MDYVNLIGNVTTAGLAVWACKTMFKNMETTHKARIAEVAQLTKDSAAAAVETAKEIKASIEKLAGQVAIANGRTAKNEQAIADQKDLCLYKHTHSRKDD
jgi:hypothetical protein